MSKYKEADEDDEEKKAMKEAIKTRLKSKIEDITNKSRSSKSNSALPKKLIFAKPRALDAFKKRKISRMTIPLNNLDTIAEKANEEENATNADMSFH